MTKELETYAPGNQRQPFDTKIITRSNKSKTTKKQYIRAIDRMADAGVNPFDTDALQDYANGLLSSNKAFLKSAIRMITKDFELKSKGSATPENVAQVLAVVYRSEALRDAIEVKKHEGTKAHTWLSQAQVKEITAACGDDLTGRRDWIVLGLLLGAGLRRNELSELTFDAIKQQPTKSGKVRSVIEVTGKGDKTRVIPIQPLLAQRLAAWKFEIGGGKIARSITRGNKKDNKNAVIDAKENKSLSTIGIFKLVSSYGAKIGKPELAPHDLRRTYAQIAYNAGVPITQISVLLGHSSTKITEGYLDLSLDLETSASDFIPLSGD